MSGNLAIHCHHCAGGATRIVRGFTEKKNPQKISIFQKCSPKPMGFHCFSMIFIDSLWLHWCADNGYIQTMVWKRVFRFHRCHSQTIGQAFGVLVRQDYWESWNVGARIRRAKSWNGFLWFSMILETFSLPKPLDIGQKTMDFNEKPHFWQTVAPSSGGLWECRDMFLISESRDLAIPGHLIRWYSRHAIEKNPNVEAIFSFSQTRDMDRSIIEAPKNI